MGGWLSFALSFALVALAALLNACVEHVELAPAASDGGVRACTPAVAGQTCTGIGEHCGADQDCCSVRCVSGLCLPAGSCSAPGGACVTRATCCSGRCEPTPVGRVCLDYCARDGTTCASDLDCCSQSCVAGVCAGYGVCTPLGVACAASSECCAGGVCANVPGQCIRATDECLCVGSACVTSKDCCTGQCYAGSCAATCIAVTW
jgi:hypothetical protein